MIFTTHFSKKEMLSTPNNIVFFLFLWRTSSKHQSMTTYGPVSGFWHEHGPWSMNRDPWMSMADHPEKYKKTQQYIFSKKAELLSSLNFIMYWILYVKLQNSKCNGWGWDFLVQTDECFLFTTESLNLNINEVYLKINDS